MLQLFFNLVKKKKNLIVKKKKKKNKENKLSTRENKTPRMNCPIAIKIVGYQEQTMINKRLKFLNNWMINFQIWQL